MVRLAGAAWSRFGAAWTIGLALVSLLGCGGEDPREEHAALERRSVPVVLFLVDTLRADRLGCYGHARDTSPSLDALASEGTLFRSCQASSTWTKPATASILTGRRPSEHGAVQMLGPLRADVTTLAETLRARGYRTAGFGSNAFVFGAEQGFERGFDVFEGGWDLAASDGPDAEDAEALRADVLVDAAIDWLEGVGDEPFFLYVHAIDPHAPYDPPAAWDERFSPRRESGTWTDERLSAKPASDDALPPEALERMLDLYDAEVAFADHELGRLLDALRARGAYDDSLIVFVADHGEEFRDHGGWGHNPRMYQEVLRVPLVVRFPWAVPRLSGVVHDDVVRQVDVAATVADVLGLPTPAGPGRSLLEQVLCPAVRAPFAIAEADYRGTSRRAIVRDGMKYVQVLAPWPAELLFDLERDPGETQDLAADRPGVAAFLRSTLQAALPPKDEAWVALVHNDTQASITVTGVLESDAPLRLDPFLLEMEREQGPDPDGPLQNRRVENQGHSGWASGFTLHVAPGDRDGVVFVPSSGEDEVDFAVFVDGVPFDLLLGPDRELSGGGPIHPLDLTRTDLTLSGPPPVDEADAGEVSVRVWRSPGATPVGAELSPETERNLRQLGYVGGG